jgi:hypothetical protein
MRKVFRQTDFLIVLLVWVSGDNEISHRRDKVNEFPRRIPIRFDLRPAYPQRTAMHHSMSPADYGLLLWAVKLDRGWARMGADGE